MQGSTRNVRPRRSKSARAGASPVHDDRNGGQSPRVPRNPAPSGIPTLEALPATAPRELQQSPDVVRPRCVCEPHLVNFNNHQAWQIDTRHQCQTCGACWDFVVHLSTPSTREDALRLSNILRDCIDDGDGMCPKCSAHTKRDELSHSNRDEDDFDWDMDSDGNFHEKPDPTDFDFF